jgi:glyoxylase-like metal-dependent hydrolase (beta-lactamase superfamily II)
MNDHHHHHDHNGDSLSLEEKFKKMFTHWIKHNQSHAETYLDWRKKAADAGMSETASLLKEISAMTEAITEKLQLGEKTIQ